uniref:Uncharacterized protein n=1 Tax=Romanomermis culicivorax TaxID=13658 RepID=A0A915KY62_ROMCU
MSSELPIALVSSVIKMTGHITRNNRYQFPYASKIVANIDRNTMKKMPGGAICIPWFVVGARGARAHCAAPNKVRIPITGG